MSQRSVQAGQGMQAGQYGQTHGRIVPSGAAERLSAAMDGEWESVGFAADDAVATRLTVDEQQQWSLYHLVGDALRSDELATSPAADRRFMQQFSARLAAEPSIVAPVSTSMPSPTNRNGRNGNLAAAGGFGRWALGRRVMPSFAAAAAAATLAWVLVPSLHGTDPATQMASLSVPGGAQSSQDGWQRVNLSSDRDLDPYLEAHQQFASDRGGLGYADYAGSAGH